ncbi:MAG: hypothetical protein J6U72_03170 [Clostridia bacterium]|nr:hypothetical protein [Clostridia bacterium]
MNEEIRNETEEENTREELDQLKAEIRARRLLSDSGLPEEALKLLDTSRPDGLEAQVSALKELVRSEAARLCEERLAGMAPSPLSAPVNYDEMTDREYYALKMR